MLFAERPVCQDAVCNFLVGGVIRRLQDAQVGRPTKKFAFLFHTESQRAAHAWQEEVVQGLRDQLTDAVDKSRSLLETLLVRAYEDLKRSIEIQGSYLPPLNAVLEATGTALRDGWLMITKVNSEQEVEQLLDDEGQLRRAAALPTHGGDRQEAPRGRAPEVVGETEDNAVILRSGPCPTSGAIN